jgi:hypothetical protein
MAIERKVSRTQVQRGLIVAPTWDMAMLHRPQGLQLSPVEHWPEIAQAEALINLDVVEHQPVSAL